MDDYQRIIEFLPNLRDFPISRYVGLGVGWTRTPKRDTFYYYVSKVSLVQTSMHVSYVGREPPVQLVRFIWSKTLLNYDARPTARRACNTCPWIIRSLRRLWSLLLQQIRVFVGRNKTLIKRLTWCCLCGRSSYAGEPFWQAPCWINSIVTDNFTQKYVLYQPE